MRERSSSLCDSLMRPSTSPTISVSAESSPAANTALCEARILSISVLPDRGIPTMKIGLRSIVGTGLPKPADLNSDLICARGSGGGQEGGQEGYSDLICAGKDSSVKCRRRV
eukprot:5804479-Pyramimonas_sp.AAC.1